MGISWPNIRTRPTTHPSLLDEPSFVTLTRRGRACVARHLCLRNNLVDEFLGKASFWSFFENSVNTPTFQCPPAAYTSCANESPPLGPLKARGWEGRRHINLFSAHGSEMDGPPTALGGRLFGGVLPDSPLRIAPLHMGMRGAWVRGRDAAAGGVEASSEGRQGGPRSEAFLIATPSPPRFWCHFSSETNTSDTRHQLFTDRIVSSFVRHYQPKGVPWRLDLHATPPHDPTLGYLRRATA